MEIELAIKIIMKKKFLGPDGFTAPVGSPQGYFQILWFTSRTHKTLLLMGYISYSKEIQSKINKGQEHGAKS